MSDRVRLDLLAAVAGGGALGALGRYAVGTTVPGPGGTLLANVLGSFALAVVLYGTIYAGGLGVRARTAITTGFLSSFTTYSTFAVGTATLPPALAGLNVLATYTLGLGAVLLGRAVARVAATGGGTPA